MRAEMVVVLVVALDLDLAEHCRLALAQIAQQRLVFVMLNLCAMDQDVGMVVGIILTITTQLVAWYHLDAPALDQHAQALLLPEVVPLQQCVNKIYMI